MNKIKKVALVDKPPSNKLQKWYMYVGLFSALSSFIIALWSITLTIYYKNSIQKVEDLDKVIKELRAQSDFQKDQINELNKIAKKSNDIDSRLIELNLASNIQNRLINENSEPVLKDLIYTFKKINGTYPPKFIFDLVIKNFGGRAAYNLDVKLFFLKLNDDKTKIISHGTQSFSKDKEYQETISANETREYQQINNFSENGYKDLNTIMLVIRITYRDKVINKLQTVNYYYTHTYDDKTDQMSISTADSNLKKLAYSYLSKIGV